MTIVAKFSAVLLAALVAIPAVVGLTSALAPSVWAVAAGASVLAIVGG